MTSLFLQDWFDGGGEIEPHIEGSGATGYLWCPEGEFVQKPDCQGRYGGGDLVTRGLFNGVGDPVTVLSAASPILAVNSPGITRE